MKNSTVSGNAGVGISADATVELSNVTITENDGGGVTAGSVVLRNTIVAGNLPADCVVASTAPQRDLVPAERKRRALQKAEGAEHGKERAHLRVRGLCQLAAEKPFMRHNAASRPQPKSPPPP